MYQLYGQSECPAVTVLAPRHHVFTGTTQERRYLLSAGRATPNTEVKIIADDGQEPVVGEPGEIYVRNPGVMVEIWGDPVATADRFTDDGYLRTRDIGYLDNEGFLYLADRKEDMIISGGFNVWPAEVENALCGHPAVLEAAVVGVPHEKWGETVLAVVVLREGHRATEQELIAWCREKVGSVKKPTVVQISTEPLPKSAVGKLLRRAVTDKYWQSEERAVHGA